MDTHHPAIVAALENDQDLGALIVRFPDRQEDRETYAVAMRRIRLEQAQAQQRRKVAHTLRVFPVER